MLISKSLWLNIQIILESWEFNYTCIYTNVSSEIGKNPCAKVLSEFLLQLNLDLCIIFARMRNSVQ